MKNIVDIIPIKRLKKMDGIFFAKSKTLLIGGAVVPFSEDKNILMKLFV